MRTNRAVPGLLGFAAFVRLFYVAQNRHSPFFTHPIIDGAEYVARARAILADGPGWDHVPIHAPLYPSLDDSDIGRVVDALTACLDR